MKMRTLNHLTAGVIVIVNVLAMIAILTGAHTLFGTVAVSVSLVVSIGCYLRVVIGMAAMQISDNEEMIDISIYQSSDPSVPMKFAEWIRKGDRNLMGGRFTDICVGRDEDGEIDGYWLLMVGPKSAYQKIKKKFDRCTVLDYWPLDMDKWAGRVEQELCPPMEEDFDDAIPELKG